MSLTAAFNTGLYKIHRLFGAKDWINGAGFLLESSGSHAKYEYLTAVETAKDSGLYEVTRQKVGIYRNHPSLMLGSEKITQEPVSRLAAAQVIFDLDRKRLEDEAVKIGLSEPRQAEAFIADFYSRSDAAINNARRIILQGQDVGARVFTPKIP